MSATPSSSRTTPDPPAARKQPQASALSVASTTSTVRTATSAATAPPQPLPRTTLLQQQPSTSRLQAPKSLQNLHAPNPTTAEEGEDVPPVPAIPTNYQSPKMSPAEFEKRRNLGVETSSIGSTSAGSTTADTKPGRHRSVRRTNAYVPPPKESERLSRKTLPPLKLSPISAQTVTAIQGLGASRDQTTPPIRGNKTPTTPLTASRSTFFSRPRGDDARERHPRSSSSVHQPRFETPSVPDVGLPTDRMLHTKTSDLSRKSSFSPFLTSSIPKILSETPLSRRTAATDLETMSPIGLAEELGNLVLTDDAPPLAKTVRRVATSPPPPPKPPSSPEEPPTPSSMSSLRRKLSLSSWKRNTSKSSVATPSHQPQNSANSLPEPPARYEAMPPPPPPRKPHAADHTPTLKPSESQPPTPSTSSAAKKPYLESRRRKSSASSLTAALGNGTHKQPPPPPHPQPQPEPRIGDPTKKEPLPEASAAPTAMPPADRRSLSRNTSVMHKILRAKASTVTLKSNEMYTAEVDKDDVLAEDEMRRLGARRKETEIAGRTLDALRKRATPKERVSNNEARRIAMLNVYERGEIMDFPDVFFCGTQHAQKVIGNHQSTTPNFGYDDERGDYTIVVGDHLAYRYEVVDVLGKGSFGQVVRCIDHKTGILVAVKIIRNKKRFHQQALVEVNILKKIREWVSGAWRWAAGWGLFFFSFFLFFFFC
jgi:dual specificity tyrosine-phosphorylation-regulated kinase 2/3/4